MRFNSNCITSYRVYFDWLLFWWMDIPLTKTIPIYQQHKRSSQMQKITPKKALAVVLTLTLLVSTLFVVTAFAANNELKVTVGNVSGKAGQSVSVPVTVSDNPGLVQFYSELIYDTSKLTLESIIAGAVFTDAAHGNNLSVSPFALNWDMSTASSNNISNGVIVTLNFIIKDDVALGEIPVTVTPSYIADFNLERVDFEAIEGKVVVQPPAVESIEMKSQPAKTSYKEGEALDVVGAKITVNYDNGTTKEVEITDSMVSGYAPTPGQKTITVTYNENGVTKTTTFNVTVAPKGVSDVTLKSAPTKIEYIEGQNIAVAGAKITVSYDNNTSEDIDVTADMLSGYDANEIGTQTVTVTYGAKTTTFDITVIAKTLTGISLDTTNAKVTYLVGTELDVSGLVIIASYDNGIPVNILATADLVTGFDKNTLGTQILVVTYEEFTAEYEVEVAEEIEDTTKPTSEPTRVPSSENEDDLSFPSTTKTTTVLSTSDNTYSVSSGDDSQTANAKDTPKTSDNSQITIYAVLSLLSATALIAMVVSSKKKSVKQ